MERKHLPGLDGLRAVGAVMVMVFHATYGVLPELALGVDLFFVISGFLITKILIVEIEEQGQFPWVSFYRRRIMRILPPLLLAEILYVVLIVFLGVKSPTPKGWLAINFFFANAVLWHQLGALSTTWSLAVEEQFYLIWPLLFVAAILLRNTRVLFWAASLAVGFSLLSRIVALLCGVNPERIYMLTVFRVDGLGIGCLLALYWRYKEEWVQKLHSRLMLLKYPLTAVLIAAPMLALGRRTDSFTLSVGLTLFSFIAGGLVLYYSRGGTVFASFLDGRIATFLGKRSYGLYIYHMPIFEALEPFRVHGDVANLVVISAVRIAAAVGIAHLSYELVERRFMRLGHARPRLALAQS
jgi:peptidoglycan/LPS O-acetylase OafA/YrhL